MANQGLPHPQAGRSSAVWHLISFLLVQAKYQMVLELPIFLV